LLLYSLAFHCEAVPGICHLEKLLLVFVVLHVASERAAFLSVLSVFRAL
jgi:hypothetical protein